MSELEEISQELSELCFGRSEPLAELVNQGRLPEGWKDHFITLLLRTRLLISPDTLVPARLLVCIHFASIYPWIRYIAWSRGQHENPTTRRELAQVSQESELLLMSLANDTLAAEGARLAVDGPLRGDDAGLAARLRNHKS